MDDAYEPSYVELGEPVEVFRPSLANVIAGYILSALAVLAGLLLLGCIVMIANNPKEKDEFGKAVAIAIVGVAGIGFTAGGLVFAWFSLMLCSYRVEICENGFRYHARGDEVAAQWKNIANIRQTTVIERPPILHPPANLLLPKVSSVSYTIVLKSGKECEFDGNRVKSIRKFGRLLESMASRHLISWEHIEKRDIWN